MEDSHRPEKEFMTVQEIFEESSNVGVSQIITSLFENQPEAFTKKLRDMSLDQLLGIEIPGEGQPYIKDPSDKKYWYGTSLPWMSIGYELTLTPLQILTFYNAIANNGVMVKPLFVSEIREGGQVTRKTEPVVLNPSVCSPATLTQARILLESVVTNGTASLLKDSIYSVAGKTGTALIADGALGYTVKKYNASFVGYFPADNPKYSCIVFVNRPESGKIYGGAVAAPVFKEIADKVYATQLDIHDQEERNFFVVKSYPSTAKGSFHDLYTSLSAMSYAIRKPSNIPEWAVIDSARAGIVFQEAMYNMDTIPDLTGMTGKDAVYMMEKAGIASIIEGKGTVSLQSLPSGTPLQPGLEIILTLGDTLQ
jgi:cell division protein FtsI (penicillin-binding protein 3)